MIMQNCTHDELYPSMDLLVKMNQRKEFIFAGDWECLNCKKHISIECPDECEHTQCISKDGEYEYTRVNGQNQVTRIGD